MLKIFKILYDLTFEDER